MTRSTNGAACAQDVRTQPDPLNPDKFIGTEELIDKQAEQLKEFERWYERRDWLAFHNHHYDWWMFPINEISSRGMTFQLTEDALYELRQNQSFINNLRRGVFFLAESWGWDIEQRQPHKNSAGKQAWAHWPVRLYKAGKCMMLFGQDDYYQSLKALAHIIKNEKKEKLDFFSHTNNAKVDVLEQWAAMEQPM